MMKESRVNGILFGMIFTVASALLCVALAWVVYFDKQAFARMQLYLFDCGVDAMGAMICAALYFGCMKQGEEESKAFRALNILVSANFTLNAFMYYTLDVPENSAFTFTFCLLSKLIDLVMIYFFYQYVRKTLMFEGKLARWADKGIPVLMVLETLFILSNIFYPVTFFIDAGGMYQNTGASAAEDIYLIVASVITAILIIRSKSPRRQKAAALTFILLPVLNYAIALGTFGNASQYGMILMSLIIMYCIIFNDKSSKLASTQTELNMARDIQSSALPSVFPDSEAFDLYACMSTAKEVGGDFFDFFMIDEDRLCFLIADVSGKGVPAALFMMTSKTMIKDYVMTQGSTAEIFTGVNGRLCENNEKCMFATAWIGILDIRTRTLQYTNAGHNYPVLQRKGQPCELLKEVHGLFLGGMEFTQYRQDEIHLEPGDRLLLYTDGIVEAHNQTDKLYGNGRLQVMLENTRDCPGKQAAERILGDVNDFATGVAQFDDITMLILTIKE